MSGYNRQAWVIFPRPNPQAAVRLFCFTYAGGGTAFYSTWPAALPAEVEVCPIRLPGRESRLSEKPYTRVEAIVPPLMEALQPFLDKPFVFFGHSMGGFVAFETAVALRAAALPQPQQLFISGTRAAHLPDPDEPIYHLPREVFISELRRLNGTPEAVLENKDLLDLLLPVIRADFEASDLYKISNLEPLGIPITAFGGTDDPKATPGQLAAWRERTTAAFKLHILPGDHFFLHSQKEALLKLLAAELRELTQG